MKILENIEVPTGNILVVEGQKGKLELLSIGDYGKEVNLKCDVLGLTRDIQKVEHTEMLPLEEKWVVTISTQYGCSMNCTFCDVPKVGPGRNATFKDLKNQILTGLALHPEVTWTNRLNVHFARMGEPTFNREVLEVAKWLKTDIDLTHRVHPVVSTMMPRKNKFLGDFISEWMAIKNYLYEGEAGLQLSINSTDPTERAAMFSGNACTLPEIAVIMKGIKPKGRKITLNFAVADYEIDPLILRQYFHPDDYIVKLTPMHKTATALKNDIKTEGDYTSFYPYAEHEEALKAVGYDVLVFIASVEEDLGRITCGNAVLSGLRPSF
jgi:23S rRNA (adenine2503-C2)-methyltransferase